MQPDPEYTPPLVPMAVGQPRSQGLVVISASAGGLKAVGTVLAPLPPDFPAAIAIVQHRSSHGSACMRKAASGTKSPPTTTPRPT